MIHTTAQFNCASASHYHKISDLRKWVRDLTDALVGMKALELKVAYLEWKLSTIRDGPSSSNVISSPSLYHHATPVTNSNTNQVRKSGPYHDHRFNLIIPKCLPNIKRFKQLQLDQHKVLKELSQLDGSINPICVKDTFWLGKYKEDSNQPRPILVKLRTLLLWCSMHSFKEKFPRGSY